MPVLLKFKKIFGSLFSILQKVGQSFMFPIAILPIAGLLLGVGASFSNPEMINSYNLNNILGSGTFWNSVFVVMRETGSIIFDNLPVIFAMGVAIGMASKEKSTVAISAFMSFVIMHKTISCLLELHGRFAPGVLREGSIDYACGIKTLEMGVFGGIIVGLLVSYLHNKFYKIKLPSIISFFSGVKFVPIISCLCHIILGIIMYFIWPCVQTGMYNLGKLVTASNYFGTFVYGIIERALIPFGLHHVFYTPFWQTALGGAEIIDGRYVTGALKIFFAELASPNISRFSIGAARFMSGKFPFMIFGLPAAALAMYHTANSDKKKIVGGLLLSAAITSILTGITEPIEFTFLFVAPVLYAIHCVFAGISFMLMHIFKITVGMTFSGGFIDLLLFGILQGNSKTNWMYIIPIGLVYSVIYYFLFKFVIIKFNLKTPGREDKNQESKLYTKKDFQISKNTTLKNIVDGLGGIDNISDLDCCATRLRITVNQEDKVNKEILETTGCSAVIQSGTGVQIVFGPQVSNIKSELDEYIELVSKT